MTTVEGLIGLDSGQIAQLEAYQALLLEINERHNLISESSAPHFWERHIRHSLSLAIQTFPPGCTVVDWGSGGGLPGIPLAIAFPQVEFITIDSVGKKVQAVKLIARRLQLNNVAPWHGRAEKWQGRANYAVSRATAPLDRLWAWTNSVLDPVDAQLGDWRQGLLALKGGDLSNEIALVREQDPLVQVDIKPLAPILGVSFQTKVLVHVSA